jgi:hypothetical protein
VFGNGVVESRHGLAGPSLDQALAFHSLVARETPGCLPDPPFRLLHLRAPMVRHIS